MSLLPGGNIRERFLNARTFGFDAIEIGIGPNFDLIAHLDEIRDVAHFSGLPVSAICTHPMHDPLMPHPDDRTRRFSVLTELLQRADELGAEGVISVPIRNAVEFPDLDDEEKQLTDLAVAEFTGWAEELPSGAAAVFLEPLNRYEATFLRRVGQAAAMTRRIQSSRVRALADLFHMNIEEADMSEPIRAASGQLGYVHIADNNRLQPGAGCLDFRIPFRALKEIAYAGYLSIECTGLGGPGASGGIDAMFLSTAKFIRNQWQAV
jgi:sugar phosphate isomerase/epimerase